MNKLLLFGSLFFLSAWQAGLSAANEGKLVVNVPKNIEGGGLVSIKGVVEDESLSSSNLVKLFIDGKEYVSELTDGGFSFDNVLDLPENSVVSYRLQYVSAEDTVENEGTISSFTKKILVEEGTGMWCGGCPAGAVALEQMEEAYPGVFASVSLHYGTERNIDPLGVPELIGPMEELLGNAYPTLIMNRKQKCKGHPSDWKRYYAGVRNLEPVAGLTLDAVIDEDTSRIWVDTEILFSESYENADFRLGYYIIENNVHSDDESYNQTNYYAGGAMGSMGGFEDLPNPVPASLMYYNEVARGVSGDFYGVEGSVPAVITAGQPVHYGHSVVLPETIMSKTNVEIIVFLVDNATGEVENCETFAVKDLAVGGVGTVGADMAVRAWGCDGTLVVKGEDALGTVEIYTLDGVLVKSVKTSSNEISLPADVTGIAIVKVAGDNGQQVMKVAL